MQAVILSIGDELVLGQTVDTNSAFLSAELVRLGISTRYHQTLADDHEAIARALEQAARSAEVVIATGGLGPTEDDLSRQGLAQALGVDLVEDPESLAAIADFFARRGRPMAESNRVQARLPRGAAAIPNACGTAPGIRARLHGATVYVTPGVPREMQVMWQDHILPELRGRADRAGRTAILTLKINTFGAGESNVGQALGPLMDRARNPKVGTTVSGGIVAVRIRSEFADPVRAQAELESTAAAVESVLGPLVFGREQQTLQDDVVARLKARRLTLASAESCTAGALGAALTDVPGASAVYLGGWVTYCNAMKQAELGVPGELLAAHGAVSQPVVRAMAAGAARRAEADLALAITGIAGPDGGSPDKPVGTVWVGMAFRDAAGNLETDALRLNLPGERPMVRDRAVKSALQMLRLHLLGAPLEHLSWGRRQPM